MDLSKLTTKQLATRIALIAIAAIALGILVNLIRTSGSKSLANIELKHGTLLPQGQTIKAFSLTDERNQAFTDKQLKGKWTFLFFGFTNCPSICPTTMATLNKLYQTLGKSNDLAGTEFMFISVDPERDSVSRIEQYVHGFNRHFRGARGSEKAINALTKQLHVLYMKVTQKGQSAKDYNIDHSGTILLINPKGQLQAVFGMPHNADNLSEDFREIISAYS